MTLPTSTMLITGGAGFIGANFVRALLAKDPHANIVVLDSLTYAGNLMNLEGISTERCTFVRGDIRDTSLVCGLLAVEVRAAGVARRATRRAPIPPCFHRRGLWVT